MLLSVGRNLQGVEMGWSFICSNWSLLVSRFGGSFAMSQIASYPSEFVTQQHAQQVEQFFKTHTAPAGERAAKQAIEKYAGQTQHTTKHTQAAHPTICMSHPT